MEIKAIFAGTRTMFHFIFAMDDVKRGPINVRNHKCTRGIISKNHNNMKTQKRRCELTRTMITCEGQGLGVVELPRLHGLLLLLQSCEHVSEVQLHGALALLSCRLGEGLLPDPRGRREGRDHTGDLPRKREGEKSPADAALSGSYLQLLLFHADFGVLLCSSQSGSQGFLPLALGPLRDGGGDGDGGLHDADRGVFG